jgi:hypothetical protein
MAPGVRVTGSCAWLDRETHLLSPLAQSFEMAPQFMPPWGEPVAGAAYVLHLASGAKLTQPLCEDSRGHLRNPRRKRAVRELLIVHLPQQPQRPAAAQHIEQVLPGRVLACLP